MDESYLSTSPTSSMLCCPHVEKPVDDAQDEELLNLEEFIQAIPGALCARKALRAQAGSIEDPVFELFERLRLDEDEWSRFLHFAPGKNYTRNLIATDNETFTLLLLCWNPDRESPIHDHPCDGCWMRVLQGEMRECRYIPADGVDNDRLVCTQDKTYKKGGTVFIEDSQGYHKVGNPSKDGTPAVTIHLYSPPFQSCKIWLNESRKPSRSCMCNYSEYGEKV